MNKKAIANVGKIKEQIENEYKARRNYPLKWSKFYDEAPWDDIYNPNNLSKQVKEQLKSHDLNPYKYKNEAEGYFVSPGMHEALLAKCRCGRPRSDIHILKCLQNQKPKYETEENANESDEKILLPKTSNAFVGWKKSNPKYQQWEQSMKYISPIYDMPGERVTTAPYSILYIA